MDILSAASARHAARTTATQAQAGLLRGLSRRREAALARGDEHAVARCEEQIIRYELALAADPPALR